MNVVPAMDAFDLQNEITQRLRRWRQDRIDQAANKSMDAIHLAAVRYAFWAIRTFAIGCGYPAEDVREEAVRVLACEVYPVFLDVPVVLTAEEWACLTYWLGAFSMAAIRQPDANLPGLESLVRKFGVNLEPGALLDAAGRPESASAISERERSWLADKLRYACQVNAGDDPELGAIEGLAEKLGIDPRSLYEEFRAETLTGPKA